MTHNLQLYELNVLHIKIIILKFKLLIMEKNIWLLPTDKPSRLHLGNSGLVLCDLNFGKNTINGQNIYITNTEKPKGGEYGLGFAEGTQTHFVFKHDGSNVAKLNALCENTQKIIIASDTNLIADGVQSIDDEFLEWFVKNPSCEEVKVEDYPILKSIFDSPNDVEIGWQKKIIIPQEEPKLINNCPKCGLDLVEREGSKPVCHRVDCGGIILSNETLREWELKKEPKQETLAEIKKQEILNYLQICKSCGSEEVARCKWVNVNTEEIYSADSGTTLEWCFDCKSETNIIDKEDYETRNN